MPSAKGEPGDEFVTIARIVKPQGRRGEVLAELTTDFPERFAQRRRLQAQSPEGRRRPLELQDFWPHKGRMVLKFAGVDSISAAGELAGWEVTIPRAERAPLEPGWAYVSDLRGCLVIANGRELGRIFDVQFGAGEAPLLTVRRAGREYLLPLAQEFIAELDLAHRRLSLNVPEGLLDLDAPPTAEERGAG